MPAAMQPALKEALGHQQRATAAARKLQNLDKASCRLPGYMIDEPSPYAPLAEWLQFLKEMQSLDKEDPSVASMVDLAKKVIAEKLRE
jgi:hypothetical protein